NRSLFLHGRATVAARAAVGGVMSVAEVVEDEGAIARFDVAEADHLAQLALFERGAAGEVLRAYVEPLDGPLIFQQDAARAPRRLIRDESRFGQRCERTTQSRRIKSDALCDFIQVEFGCAALTEREAVEQPREHLLVACATPRVDCFACLRRRQQQ